MATYELTLDKAIQVKLGYNVNKSTDSKIKLGGHRPRPLGMNWLVIHLVALNLSWNQMATSKANLDVAIQASFVGSVSNKDLLGRPAGAAVHGRTVHCTSDTLRENRRRKEET
jgi:hypothetical protein